ncbi:MULTISPECIES: DUF427 domain-containing protein [unclassified Amycolatopsis]|uniref:DUF427 domain-containing protein n=1 Tax=unclassified Amycolatopsis TaxID=2618356 RepID=UPI0028770E08|nr:MULTISPECIES: DUF427 domain-containing protein [unclassified Amycolatopsis]MDS0138285.1 DUF427 domain-containing protein [Amycolatopsis sp. 505]MDS0149094.1 DUF427 domain-containing protein [Amycolatopsis sp. CM201R]
MAKKVLQPGPDHPITVEPTKARVVVKAGGRVVADSRNAFTLQESTYPAVQYIPLADVDAGVLERTDHETYCPYKGEASYYSLKAGDVQAENAVWTYEKPYDAVAPIKDHVAFYPNVVDSIELVED